MSGTRLVSRVSVCSTSPDGLYCTWDRYLFRSGSCWTLAVCHVVRLPILAMFINMKSSFNQKSRMIWFPMCMYLVLSNQIMDFTIFTITLISHILILRRYYNRTELKQYVKLSRNNFPAKSNKCKRVLYILPSCGDDDETYNHIYYLLIYATTQISRTKTNVCQFESKSMFCYLKCSY